MNRGRGARLPSAHTVFFPPGFTPGKGIVYRIGERQREGEEAQRERGLGRGSEGGDEDSPFIKKQSALI